MKTRTVALVVLAVTALLGGCAAPGPTLPKPITVELEKAK